MAQLVTLPKFQPGAVFASRNELYKARDEYHMLQGYKLVVPNSNKEQVIFACWQSQQNLPHGTVKCPVKIRANYQKLRWTWTISAQEFPLNLGEIIGLGDRDKGMGAAADVDRELGVVSWFNDLKHASSNIALAVKGCGLAVRMKFETAASVYTKEEARVIMQEIPHDNIAVYKYIIEAGMNNFFRSESTVPRFGMLGTQAVESFNSVTKP